MFLIVEFCTHADVCLHCSTFGLPWQHFIISGIFYYCMTAVKYSQHLRCFLCSVGDVQEAAQLLAGEDVRVNCLDEVKKKKHSFLLLIINSIIYIHVLPCRVHIYIYICLSNPALCQIVMLVKENPVLVDVSALEKCYQVMDLLCEQCVKQEDMNEVLAMKMHYISCILQKCLVFLQKCDDKLDALVKSLLRGRESDGFPQYQERFIRDCIRKFPYCEATLLQQLVRSFTSVEIGNDPTAYSVLTQALTGQMAFEDVDYCVTCGEKGADKRMCRSLQEQDADLDKDTPRLKELRGESVHVYLFLF
uniref:Ankyrin repeat and MYND domain containing 2 n=1 Tax=Cynoglossus semilaevis TaxID=244447 RepID=A0A3P8WWL2_CYNSE